MQDELINYLTSDEKITKGKDEEWGTLCKTTRTGYVFNGWIGDYSNINQNTDIIASYTNISNITNIKQVKNFIDYLKEVENGNNSAWSCFHSKSPYQNDFKLRFERVGLLVFAAAGASAASAGAASAVGAADALFAAFLGLVDIARSQSQNYGQY